MVVRIWVTSDLHTDAAAWFPVVPSHDVLVVAGDVSDGPLKVTAELTRLRGQTGKPVLFVPGNHDLIGARLRTGEFNQLPDGITVLEAGKSAILDGVRFIGATLWTDFELTETEFASQKWAIGAMPEYATIRHRKADRLIRPIDTAKEHLRDRAALSQALSLPHRGATVIVTHHAPSTRSLQSNDRFDVSSAAFASDLEALIERWQPELWIHGHVHEAIDYKIGKTRLLSNPRGVPDDFSQTMPWQEQLIVDIT